MTSDALVLVSRGTAHAHDVLETHAARLERRNGVDTVHTALYDRRPARELRDQLSAVAADEVYVLPVRFAHTNETTEMIPAALSALSGTVHYCDPLGQHPAVTDALLQRGVGVAEGPDVSLVLAGMGSTTGSIYRRTTEFHAARIRDRTEYGEVLTCYLVQDPAVECVRYNVSNDRAVVVPTFFSRTETATTQIPAKLELGRGGLEYAAPLGTHESVTDAIESVLSVQQRAVTRDGEPESRAVRPRGELSPAVTDGEG